MAYPKSRVMVLTGTYERVYGKKPSGYGYWHFTIKGGGGILNFEGTGKYSDIKKKAIEFASLNNCCIVRLES